MTVFLSLITFLLGVIATILGFGVRIFYQQLVTIERKIGEHGLAIESLETWRTDHKEEVVIQRGNWDKRESDALGKLYALERTVAQLTTRVGNGPIR